MAVATAEADQYGRDVDLRMGNALDKRDHLAVRLRVDTCLQSGRTGCIGGCPLIVLWAADTALTGVDKCN